MSRNAHLDRLEAEAIHVFREVVATCRRPVMLYSVGKDSSVLTHLAFKAFFPAKPPFPFLHVDTTWKFKEMIAFRDEAARRLGFELIVHVNPDGVRDNIDPFVNGPSHHTHVWKTLGLRQALESLGTDAAFGGARRDEEKSRAKERIFSFRTKEHLWDPKNQRPEMWKTYNTALNPGESLRVFPLSNWTELDVWLYIERENIPVVPLYFAASRSVVDTGEMLILNDDHRMPAELRKQAELKNVRFRSLGCYPLTSAVESDAATVEAVVEEIRSARTSERQGRVIDREEQSSMEKKKREGYF